MCPAAPGGIVAIEMDASAERAIHKRIGCVCGYRAEGLDDARLRRLVRLHLDRAHPELSFTEEQITGWVGSGAVFLLHPGPWPARPGGGR